VRKWLGATRDAESDHRTLYAGMKMPQRNPVFYTINVLIRNARDSPFRDEATEGQSN
jgi:hypothetical protein